MKALAFLFGCIGVGLLVGLNDNLTADQTALLFTGSVFVALAVAGFKK